MGGSPFLPGSVGASAGGGRICAPDLAPRHQLATRKALNAMFRPTLSGLFRISVSRAALISKYSAASNARSPVRRPHTPGPLFDGQYSVALEPKDQAAGVSRKREVESVVAGLATELPEPSYAIFQQHARRIETAWIDHLKACPSPRPSAASTYVQRTRRR